MSGMVFVGDLVDQNNEPWWVSKVKIGHQFVLGQRVRMKDDDDIDFGPMQKANPYFRVLSFSWDCDGTPLYNLVSTELDAALDSLKAIEELAAKDALEPRHGLDIGIYNILIELGKLPGGKRISDGEQLTVERYLAMIKATRQYLCINHSVSSIEPLSDEKLNLIPPFTKVSYNGNDYITATYQLRRKGSDGLLYDLIPDDGREISRYEFFGVENCTDGRIRNVILTADSIKK
jgi:hypothetical protein